MVAVREAEEEIELAVKLLGSENWEGLLDPLDLNLRKFILRCGDLCHAANDAFEGKGSVNGNTTFHVVPLPDSESTFHSHLYATPSLKSYERVLQYLASNSARCNTNQTEHVPTWMGYCAIAVRSESQGRPKLFGGLRQNNFVSWLKGWASPAESHRVIYISWRGTKRLSEWMNNFSVTQASVECLLRRSRGSVDRRRDEKTPRVVKGWLSIYTSQSSLVVKSARDQVKAAVEKLYRKDGSPEKKTTVVVTGHSLGSTLAILTAFDIVENLVAEDVRVVAVVFGCPRMGNRAFRERVKSHPNLNVLHVRNKMDMVTHFPPARRVGAELVVDSRKSDKPELSKSKINIGLLHDLETCVYMVAGWNGKDNGFELKVDRTSERLMKATKAFEYNRGEIKRFFSQIKCKYFKRNRSSSDSESSDEEKEANGVLSVPTKLE